MSCVELDWLLVQQSNSMHLHIPDSEVTQLVRIREEIQNDLVLEVIRIAHTVFDETDGDGELLVVDGAFIEESSWLEIASLEYLGRGDDCSNSHKVDVSRKRGHDMITARKKHTSLHAVEEG